MRTSTVLLSGLFFATSLACAGLGEDPLPVEPIAPREAPAEPTAPVLEDLLEVESVEALRAKYGDAVGTVEILENEVGDIPYPALHVGTPQEVVFLFSPDADYFGGLQINRRDSTWMSKTGLRNGLSLVEVEALNGGPFSLSGSPEGLQLTDFRGGQLDGEGVSPYFGKDGDLYPDLDAEQVDDAYTSSDLHDAGLTVHFFFVR